MVDSNKGSDAYAGEYEVVPLGMVAELRAQLAVMKAELDRASGALVDSGTVQSDDIEAGIIELVKERDRAWDFIQAMEENKVTR